MGVTNKIIDFINMANVELQDIIRDYESYFTSVTYIIEDFDSSYVHVTFTVNTQVEGRNYELPIRIDREHNNAEIEQYEEAWETFNEESFWKYLYFQEVD